MSFRNRLTLFFVLIVIVPMVSAAVVLFRLIDDSENGKADAAIAAQQQTAINLFRESRAQADVVLRQIGRDRVLAASLQAGDLDRADRRAEQLLGRGIERLAVVDGGRLVVDAGDPAATAPASRELAGRGGGSFGRLEISIVTGDAYVRRVRRVTGLDTVIFRGDERLATTLPGAGSGDERLPTAPGDVEIDGREFRVASFDAAGFGDERVRVATLAPAAATGSDVTRSRLLALAILLGFLVLAIACAVAVSRSLQQQIAAFLHAARRLTGGDFSAQVPTVGDDEFAKLGQEFNKMSSTLEARLTDLRLERERVQGSMRRLGEAVASNLDRDALLNLVVRTAVEGVAADAGRATARNQQTGTLEERAREGSMAGVQEVLRRVEHEALRAGRPREASEELASAIAHPLRGADGGDRILGLVSVARRERPFSESERELFHYLAAQAAVSMENVGLHETVARESVTDELTSLNNRRRFDETLTVEVERHKRFGGSLGLVLLDIDDFKSVNDSHGHQQGDLVLQEVARVLRETSREIDEPARYGGEELAVVLPGTDLEGAYNLAERVREGIEALRLPLPGANGSGEGDGLRVTASFGVAALPDTAENEQALLAAADAALYEAKRGGKNMSVRAG